MIRWIECLSEAGLKTALLSNMIPDMAVHARQNVSWLNKLTYQVLSCEAGWSSPIGLFMTLFVDDSETNVQAAGALGITSIRFRSVEQLRDELAASSLAILRSLSERLFPNVSSTRMK